MLRGSHFTSLVLREHQQKTFVVFREFWPLRDCQQLTSIMLNKFCLLSQTPYPVLNRQYQNGWNIYQPKSNEKYMIFLHIVFQVLKVLLIKICKNSHQIFYFQLFLLAFTDKYYFSQIFRDHSTLSKKKIFVMNFPCLTESLNPPSHPHPFNSQYLLSMTRVLC